MRKFILMTAGLLLWGPAASAAPLKIVATTAFFAEAAKEIGGDRVEVSAIAPPKFNVHFIQPRPSDVRKTAKADLFVHAGLDLEAWTGPLLEAAGKTALFRGGERNLDLSRGVPLLNVPHGHATRAEGDIHLFGNPHYPMDPRNALIVGAAIAAKLAEIDSDGAAHYAERERAFRAALESKIAEWKALCAPCAGREVLSFHDDIAYLADFLGLKAARFLEPLPGVPPTPRHLAELEAYAKEKGVRAILQPSYYEHTTAEAFAARIGAKVVFVGQNPGEIAGTDGLISFYETNVRRIAEALA